MSYQKQARNPNVYDKNLQIKQDTSKELYADPNQIWEIKPQNPGDVLSSEGENELIKEDVSKSDDNSDCSLDPPSPRRSILRSGKREKKNVRFKGGPSTEEPTQEVNYYDNEISDHESSPEDYNLVDGSRRSGTAEAKDKGRYYFTPQLVQSRPYGIPTASNYVKTYAKPTKPYVAPVEVRPKPQRLVPSRPIKRYVQIEEDPIPAIYDNWYRTTPKSFQGPYEREAMASPTIRAKLPRNARYRIVRRPTDKITDTVPQTRLRESLSPEGVRSPENISPRIVKEVPETSRTPTVKKRFVETPKYIRQHSKSKFKHADVEPHVEGEPLNYPQRGYMIPAGVQGQQYFRPMLADPYYGEGESSTPYIMRENSRVHAANTNQVHPFSQTTAVPLKHILRNPRRYEHLYDTINEAIDFDPNLLQRVKERRIANSYLNSGKETRKMNPYVVSKGARHNEPKTYYAQVHNDPYDDMIFDLMNGYGDMCYDDYDYEVEVKKDWEKCRKVYKDGPEHVYMKMKGDPIGSMTECSNAPVDASSLKKWFRKKEDVEPIVEKAPKAPRVRQMRSKRTRIHRIKSGWRKALVHTVINRNEKDGLVVLGPRGPEFYSRSKRPNSAVPFRKTKSFSGSSNRSIEKLEFGTQTAQDPLVHLTTSEPCPRSPVLVYKFEKELNTKLESFEQNVNEHVKKCEENFYKRLSNQDFNEEFQSSGSEVQKGKETEKKAKIEEMLSMEFPPFHLLPPELLSPRIPKSLKETNKETAEKKTCREEDIETTERKPEETDITEQEKMNHCLDIWGMKLEDLSENDVKEDNSKSETKIIFQNRNEEKDSPSGSVKSNEQISNNIQRRKKYYETTALGDRPKEIGDGARMEDNKSDIKRGDVESEAIKVSELLKKASKILEDEKSVEDKDENVLTDLFEDLVKNGCAISEKQSENLQEIFQKITSGTYHNEGSDDAKVYDKEMENKSSKMGCCFDKTSSSECNEKKRTVVAVEKEADDVQKECDSLKQRHAINFRRSKTFCSKLPKPRKKWTEVAYEKRGENVVINDFEKPLKNPRSGESVSIHKKHDSFDDLLSRVVEKEKKIDLSRRRKGLEGKSEKKKGRKDRERSRSRLLKDALPSVVTKTEADHLEKLKKYIIGIIDRSIIKELKTTPSMEFSTRPETSLERKQSSTESLVKVDAKKVIDVVSNPFQKIASDMTINIAKRVTDALVNRDESWKKEHSKTKRNQLRRPKSEERCTARESNSSENLEKGSPKEDASIQTDSEQLDSDDDECEPLYLKQLKKMRYDHLNNIVLEVKRLTELQRFLDKCINTKFI